MLILDSRMTMEELDLDVTEKMLLRTSRTATFTLSSSFSLSSSYSNLYNHDNGQTLTTTTTTTTTTKTRASSSSTLSNTYISEHPSLIHSQSLILEGQPRRPIIHDPYQLLPNLQTLNDWMVVSASGHLICVSLHLSVSPSGL